MGSKTASRGWGEERDSRSSLVGKALGNISWSRNNSEKCRVFFCLVSRCRNKPKDLANNMRVHWICKGGTWQGCILISILQSFSKLLAVPCQAIEENSCPALSVTAKPTWRGRRWLAHTHDSKKRTYPLRSKSNQNHYCINPHCVFTWICSINIQLGQNTARVASTATAGKELWILFSSPSHFIEE